MYIGDNIMENYDIDIKKLGEYKHNKNMKKYVSFMLCGNEAIPIRTYYYTELEDLLKYSGFLSLIYCEDISVVAFTNTDTIDMEMLDFLQMYFIEYREKTINDRIKTLQEICDMDDESNCENIKRKIKILKDKIE